MYDKGFEYAATAMERGEMSKFLLGTPEYFILDRDTGEADLQAILYSIYKYYKCCDKCIKEGFETALLDLLNESVRNFPLVLQYLRIHIFSSLRGSAPFQLGDAFLTQLKAYIKTHVNEIKRMQDADLLYEKAKETNRYCEKAYGKTFMELDSDADPSAIDRKDSSDIQHFSRLS